MATMAENVIDARSKTLSLMLEKGMYDSWKTQILLYIQGKENGEMLIDLIKNEPVKLLDEITVKDAEGVNEIVLDIYNMINHYQTAKEIWDRINEIIEGTKMTKQASESMLYDEFNKFTSEPEESIYSYYLRYAKLINDMKMILMSMSNIQINTKFVNHLQPEWSRESKGYTCNAGNNQASGARVSNTVGNAGANQTRVVRCYNCNGEGHIAKQCTTKKRVKDSECFEETDDYEDLQLQAKTNFKAHHIDAYDSEYDDKAKANAIFMANLSPVGSLNDDTVEPRYDYDILSEVPHYDTYHDSDMFNSNIQELGYIENIVSNNESYDELTSNNNAISYKDYMLTIRDDANNYVPSSIQKNDMMLSVIEQMKSQVEKCNMVNQESKSVNESLTSELE
ncbi:integrase, catalytic region, zinc finger, CCHC-type containing protein [Tanacetum coccineum]